MKPLFLYGTLRDAEHLKRVAGCVLPTRTAQLLDHAVFSFGRHDLPRLTQHDGGVAKGIVIEASGVALERLNFYEGGYGYGVRDVTVQTEQGPVTAQVYWPPEGGSPDDPLWDFETWRARSGRLMVYAAAEAMEYFGQFSPQELASRMPVIRMRAHARVLAEDQDPVPGLGPEPQGNVEIVQARRPYSHYFSLLEYDLSYPKFDGSQGPVVNRAALISADAVVVLPYDPMRDRVLMVEQFRMGPFFRGDAQCFMAEPVAGRVDPGEPPEETARREAIEEASLEIGALHLASKHYPSPAAYSEFIYVYIGIANLPDGITGVGGLEAEAEDIRSHLIDYARFEQMLDDDHFRAGPLVVAGHWLARNRERLRGIA